MTSYKDRVPFVAYMLSSMLIFAGVDAVLSLVSSVNIEGGLGTSSLAIAYGTAVLPAFMIPGFLRKVGVKNMLVFCSMCYFFFVLGNIYATPGTLIAAGVLNGIAESVGWTTSSLVNSYFARIRSIRGTKDEAVYTKHYFGYYWTASPIGSMLGNAIVFAILYFDRKVYSKPDTTVTSYNSTDGNMTSYIPPPPPDHSLCGAQDCQTEEAVEAAMAQYQPVNEITRTIVIGTCAFMILCAVVLNIVFIPSDVDQVLRKRPGTSSKRHRHHRRQRHPTNTSSSSHDVIIPAAGKKVVENGKLKKPTASARKSLMTSSSCDLLMRNGGGGHVLRHNNRVADKNNFPQLRSTPSETSTTESDSAETSGDEESGDDISLFTEVYTKGKKTGKLIFTGKQLLVMLLPIYNGLEVGFIFGEMTRAYSACVLGLDKVSVSVIMFGIANSISSFLAGHIAGRFGRNLPFIIGYIVDILLYLFCLYWMPPDNEAFIYLLFLGFGYSEGMWATLVNEMYGDLFSEQTDIAYNLWGLLLNVGMMLQYAFSRVLCVYQKIYVMMLILTIAMLLYGIMVGIYYNDRKCIQRPTNEGGSYQGNDDDDMEMDEATRSLMRNNDAAAAGDSSAVGGNPKVEIEEVELQSTACI